MPGAGSWESCGDIRILCSCWDVPASPPWARPVTSGKVLKLITDLNLPSLPQGGKEQESETHQ